MKDKLDFSRMKVNLIVAACGKSMGIGKDGQLPWRLPSEMKYFAKMTTTSTEDKKNAVVMGRKTWESIPAKFRPLKNRLNVVLTRNSSFDPHKDGVLVSHSLETALADLRGKDEVETVWIIGGNSVYAEAIGVCHRIYMTEIMEEFPCDVFFPKPDSSLFKEVEDPNVPKDSQEENNVKYRYVVLEKSQK